MSALRLLHLSQTDIRYDNRILKELTALARNREYEVFCIGFASAEAIHHSKMQHNFTIVTLSLFTEKLTWMPRSIRYALVMTEMTIRLVFASVCRRPDVVHSHDTMALPAGALIKLITGAKLIYDAHELESDKCGQSKILSKATLIFERLCWRSVDYLISVSPSIINWYKTNVGHKPSSLILNSPFIESNIDGLLVRDKFKVGYFNQLYDIPQDCLVFIYIGLLAPGRGIETTLNAFRSNMIKSHLIFVGYGKLHDEIRAIAAKHKNIHLHDPVPHEEVVSFVSHADVGLCLIENNSLSDYYCLPNKLFEYCFAGLPVLASRFPDIESVVKEYSLGYCCDIEPNSIINAIKEFERHKPSRIDTDLTPLSWNTQENILNNVYQTL